MNPVERVATIVVARDIVSVLRPRPSCGGVDAAGERPREACRAARVKAPAAVVADRRQPFKGLKGLKGFRDLEARP